MNQSVLIAWRSVWRQKKRTVLLASAIGFGFFVITMVGGFTGGLASSARLNFSNLFGGHIYIAGSQVSERGSEIAIIADAKPLEAVLEAHRDEIRAVHKRSAANGTLIFGVKEVSQKIEGVDYGAENDFGAGLQLRSGALDTRADGQALILPKDTMDKLGVKTGEAVLFKSLTASGQQNVVELTVISEYIGQSSIGTSSGYANLADINTQLGLAAGEYQTVNIWLNRMEDIDRLTETIQSELSVLTPVWERVKSDNSNPAKSMMGSLLGGGNKAIGKDEAWTGTKFRVSSLNDLMSSFMAIIGTIDLIGFWIFIILVVITMVGIMNSYRMVMIERTGEIGTMRAIGVKRRGIRDIFLWEALIIAAIGAIGGFALALLAMGLASLPNFGTQDILGFFLNRGHLRFGLAPLEILKNSIVLCIMSVAAVWLPARTASRLQPAVALRTAY